MLTSNDVYELINYTSFVESLFMAVSVAGLLWLRYKQPNRERPIKVNLGFPISFFVICVFLVVLPVYVTPMLVAVDLLFIRWRRKPKAVGKMLHMLDLGFQKLFLALPDESELPPSITITPASDD